jgi:hypothetical protein
MVSGIGSLSSIGSSFSASSTQKLSEQTKAKLESVGVDTSGIKTESEGQQILKSSMNAQGVNSAQNTDQANKASTIMQHNQPGPPPAWVSIMKQNGITPTGKIDGDKTAVASALTNMNPAEAKSLASQFQAAGLAVTAPNDSQKADSFKVDPFAGQNQLANLNRHFLVSS